MTDYLLVLTVILGSRDQFTSGRKFEAVDLQLVILALLAERPAHGYELIKTIEERSGGFYTPSPGVIYPALTYIVKSATRASSSQEQENCTASAVTPDAR